MVERPILFKPEMVKAILEGRKTQTRRLVDRQPDDQDQEIKFENGWLTYRRAGFGWSSDQKCRYGRPGDCLWVKELHCFLEVLESASKEMGQTIYDFQIEYSDGSERHCSRYNEKPKQTRERGEHKWRPSIHMPRWASRITLEITEVRIERLNDIAIGDCFREGIDDRGIMAGDPNSGYMDFARDDYRMLWERIHGPGSWGMNPLVWAVEFRRFK